jgi:hypothetical protein
VRVYANNVNISRLIYHTGQDRLTAWQRIVETYLKQTPPHQS